MLTASFKERCRRCWKYCITHPERMFALGLRIKNKEGEIVRFVLNQAQMKVMEAIHRQLETTDKIRLVIMLWRMMAKPHSNVLIMANSQKNLEQHHFKDFVKMAEHFGKEMPCPVGNATAKSFEFFSSHAVGGWANTKGGMRGFAFTSVHLTEIDYYNDFDECMQTVFPCVPDTKGTCILIESTSSGLDGNLHRFHKRNPGFEFLFLPWYDQAEYALQSDFPPVLTEEQQRIRMQYNLTDEQMNWYRQRNSGATCGCNTNIPVVSKTVLRSTTTTRICLSINLSNAHCVPKKQRGAVPASSSGLTPRALTTTSRWYGDAGKTLKRLSVSNRPAGTIEKPRTSSSGNGLHGKSAIFSPTIFMLMSAVSAGMCRTSCQRLCIRFFQ